MTTTVDPEEVIKQPPPICESLPKRSSSSSTLVQPRTAANGAPRPRGKESTGIHQDEQAEKQIKHEKHKMEVNIADPRNRQQAHTERPSMDPTNPTRRHLLMNFQINNQHAHQTY